MKRFAAALLALVLVVATGMARSVSYLCLMDGQVHSSCCCKGHAAEKSEGPRIERKSSCCELRFSEVSNTPATTKDGQQHRLIALLSVGIPPPAIDVPSPAGRDIAPAIGARAPPRGGGPPLFILNCSYLI